MFHNLNIMKQILIWLVGMLNFHHYVNIDVKHFNQIKSKKSKLQKSKHIHL